MAEKKVAIKVEVDTKGAVKNLGDLENAVKETSNEVKELGTNPTLNDRLEALNKTVKDSPVNIRAMNKQIQEYQAIALEAGRTSPIGKAALAQAADMKDRYNDINAEVNRLANDGIKMQAALDLGTSVVAGYTAFQGAMALTGVESEELQKTLVKLQGAQSLLMGIETIRKNLEKESTLVIQGKIAAENAKLVVDKLSLNNIKQSIFALFGKTAATTADTVATTGAATATTAFGAALNLLPIVAIVTGITLLVLYFDKVKDAVLGVADSLISVFKPTIDVVVDALQYFGLVESDAAEASRIAGDKKAQAAKKAAKEYIEAIEAEQEALELATNNSAKLIDAEIAKMAAAGKDTSELEKDKIELMIESTKKEIELSEKRNEARLKELEILAEFSPFLKDAALARIKELEGEKITLQENLDGFELQLEVHEIKQEKKRKDVNEKRVKDEKKVQEEITKAKSRGIEEREKLDTSFIDTLKAQSDLRLELMEEGTRKELAMSRAAFQERFLELQSQGVLTADLRAKLTEQQVERERKIEDDAKKQKLATAIENTRQLNTSLIDLNDAVLEAQLAGAKGNAAKENEIRKKSFARNKALQLSLATIDGYKAVLSAYAGTVGGPVVKGIAAGFAGALSLANIAKIARTKFEGSGGGGAAPSNLGNTGRATGGVDVGQVTNTTTTIGEPTKVYVTEQDISDTQNKVEVNEQQATL